MTLVNCADSPWQNRGDFFSIRMMTTTLLALLLSNPIQAAESPPRAMEGLRVSLSSWSVSAGDYEDAVVAKTGAVLFLRDGRLGYRLRGSTVSAPMPVGIPRGARRLLIDGTDLYAYGDGIYRYSREGSFETLLKTPAPVSALAVSPGRLVFAMEGRIYQRGGGGPFRLLFKSGLAPTIDSLAYDALSGVMFFTTRLGLYSLRTGTADLLLEGATGQLRLEGDRLILESMAEKKRFTIEGWRGVLVR